jgi:hypothetical protein
MTLTPIFARTATEVSASPLHRTLATASKGDYKGYEERLITMRKSGPGDPS